METSTMTTVNNKEESSWAAGFASSDSDDSTTLDYKLHQVFLKFFGYLNIIHINAQSIPAHHLDLLTTFSTAHNIDAILVSETFLKPGMLSIHYSLPGFKLIRNDREGKSAGGVAIYLRQGLHYTYINSSPSAYTKSAEHLFIEIYPGGSKVLLGVYYSPSKTIDYFPSFESLLKSLRPKYENVLILGDFNTCLLKNDKRSQKLLNILDSNTLNILPLEPTHFAPNTKPSLLDLIIVSDLNKVAKHGQLTGCFSHHDMLFLSYKVPSPKQNNCSSFVMEIAQANDTVAMPQLTPVLDPIWQTKDVKQALGKQLKAKRKLKRKRTQSVLIDYQICRDDFKKFEEKHKRLRAQSIISRRKLRKTKCHICEPRNTKTT